jgi:hypothetical protein
VKEQFLREIRVRKMMEFDRKFVIDLMNFQLPMASSDQGSLSNDLRSINSSFTAHSSSLSFVIQILEKDHFLGMSAVKNVLSVVIDDWHQSTKSIVTTVPAFMG